MHLLDLYSFVFKMGQLITTCSSPKDTEDLGACGPSFILLLMYDFALVPDSVSGDGGDIMGSSPSGMGRFEGLRGSSQVTWIQVLFGGT